MEANFSAGASFSGVGGQSEPGGSSRNLGVSAFQGMELLRELVARRKQLHYSQTQIAEKMKTSQSAVARIEAGEIDIRLSTLDRYADAVGQKISFKVIGKTSARKTKRRRGPVSLDDQRNQH